MSYVKVEDTSSDIEAIQVTTTNETCVITINNENKNVEIDN